VATAEHEKLESLFSAALERRSGAERTSFLDAACSQDAACRSHVERLLRIQERLGSFLEVPAVETDATVQSPVPNEVMGTMIGRYKILEEIGEGGFGVVYLAQQEEPVRRRVALKILKLGMDTREVIARFEAERQALALMDHPNIARVLDAGATEAGRPYFVMELARGARITEYCDAHKLATADRLRLLLPVCHAVQHAHQKGIIHRDLKPGNVLVTLQDGQPVPKVIDFGIAKATSQRLTTKTLFTRLHQFLGTPEYMSPDQVAGEHDVDTRTDVYSLGVLLYELLTSVTPFDRATLRAASFDEIKRIIREVEPPKPSTRVQTLVLENAEVAACRRVEPAALHKLLRGDLDWIVMRALEKDRTQRYATAKDLADDIERHLRHEPVVAGPPSARYRLRKFVWRHRIGVLTGSIAVSALILGLVLASVGWVQAHQAQRALEEQRDAAREARGHEHEQRALAEAGAEEARKQAARSAAVSEFLQEMLSSVDPSKTLGREVTVRYALDEAAKRIESGALAQQPEVEATLRATLGETYAALGLYKTAEKHLRAAHAIQSRLLGPEQRETLRTSRALAGVLRVQGKFAEAETLLRQTAEAQRRVLGAEHPDTLTTLKELALALWGPRRFAEAEAIHRSTLETQRRTLGEEHPDTIESLGHLGAVCRAQGKLAEAEPLLRRALELSRRVLGDAHPATAVALNNLGHLLEDQGKPAEAESLYRQGYEVERQILGADHPRTALSMNDLLRVLRSQGKMEEVRPLVVERLARLRRAAERPDADASALHTYAWELLHCEPADVRDPAAALPVAQKAVALNGGEDAGMLETLALAFQMTGNLDQAIETQRRAIARARLGGPYSRSDLEAKLADYLVARGDVVEAARLPWDDLTSRVLGSFMGETVPGEALITQSEGLMREGRFDEAASVLRGCLATREKLLPQGNWLVADTRSRLGAALAGAARYAEAEPLLLDAYAAMSDNRLCPPDCRRQAVQRIVQLYESWGKAAQAAEWRLRLEDATPAAGGGG
jgi:tetratricopeptide (TPR) repeat protein